MGMFYALVHYPNGFAPNAGVALGGGQYHLRLRVGQLYGSEIIGNIAC